MAVPYVSSYDLTLPFSDVCEQFSLVSDTELSYTIPGTKMNKYSMEIHMTSISNIFVGYNVTASYPATGTQTAIGKLEFRPPKRYVIGGDVINLITPDTSAYVGISLRAIPNPGN